MFVSLYLSLNIFSFSQNAPVILAPHSVPAAPCRVSATADPITAARHVTSAPPVTMATQAARVSQTNTT